MVTQKSVMGFFNKVSGQKTASAEPVKGKTDGNQFMQIMSMLEPKVDKTRGDICKTQNYDSSRGVNNSRKLFETSKNKNIIGDKNIADGIKKFDNSVVSGEKATAKTTDESKKPVAMEAADREVKNNEISSKKVIDNIAEVLGLTSAELQMLLNAAGIKVSELNNESETEMISEKLADFIGLDNKLKQELQLIISSITKQDDASNEKLLNINGISVEEMRKRLNIQGSLEVRDISKTVSEELCKKLKDKLLDLAEASEEGKGATEDTGSKEVLTMVNENKTSESVFTKLPENRTTAPVERSLKKEKVEKEDVKLDDGVDAEEVELNTENKISDEKKPLLASTRGESVEMHPGIAQFNSNTEKAVQEILKPFTENIKPENEIVKQVVEKARVILDGDKSEMVLSLKPESLGKLSLKVITENGIVMAKFVAENHQVKQILESNMQFLKENLEKQGLNVQGFSVSVRQDSGDDEGHYSNGSEGRRNISTKLRNVSGIVADMSGLIQTENENTYLNWGNSTINLTA